MVSLSRYVCTCWMIALLLRAHQRQLHCYYYCRVANLSERSEADNRGLFEIPQYCIYIYVCLQVHCTRPCTPYTSPITSVHCALPFETLAAVRSTTLRSRPLWGAALSLGMANGANSVEDRPDDDSKLSHTCKLLDTGSAAQARLRHSGKNDWHPNDFSIFLSLFLLHIIHVPFHMHYQLTERIFTLCISLLCYY